MKTQRMSFKLVGFVVLMILIFQSVIPALLQAKNVSPNIGAGPALLAPVAQTGDVIPPGIVTNLTATADTQPGTVDLTWTAPGDDGATGTATSYIIRYNTEPITASNWISSTDISGEPTPATAGITQTMTVTGLTPGQTYYFALKSQDEVPNLSEVSNSARATTRPIAAVYLPLILSGGSGNVAVIPDTTEVLTDVIQYLGGISGDGSVFTFTQQTADLNAVAPGDVIVGDVSANAPDGFLRKVTAVSTPGGQVVIQTEPATLEEAIETGSAHINRALSPNQIRSSTQLAGVTLRRAPQSTVLNEFSIALNDVVLYDDDGDPTTKNDQIRADGSITMKIDFDFNVKVKWFKLDELSFTTNAQETAELKLKHEITLELLHNNGKEVYSTT